MSAGCTLPKGPNIRGGGGLGGDEVWVRRAEGCVLVARGVQILDRRVSGCGCWLGTIGQVRRGPEQMSREEGIVPS